MTLALQNVHANIERHGQPGSFMAYGRLYVESEMLILGACGAGRWRSRA